jgi:hypothetical protein
MRECVRARHDLGLQSSLDWDLLPILELCPQSPEGAGDFARWRDRVRRELGASLKQGVSRVSFQPVTAVSPAVSASTPAVALDPRYAFAVGARTFLIRIPTSSFFTSDRDAALATRAMLFAHCSKWVPSVPDDPVRQVLAGLPVG